MDKTTILRRRYIPDEIVDISNDEIQYRDEKLLVTKWNAIKPRADISGGISYALLDEGIKISRFYNSRDEFIYWYCDIIDVEYYPKEDKYIFNDLLVDVKIYPDSNVEVLDVDELAEAMQKGLITREQACRSLINLDKLLKMIYKGQFPPEGVQRG
ncbi:MAG: hypothetical protein K0R31_1402 [Clostridiales bacterium]|jgi:predicted RNA-binding protein associated with RNAse of E/G family|nr:hypothetical protein [Clostridiales bacterium]